MGQMYFPGERRNSRSSYNTSSSNHTYSGGSSNDDNDWKWGCGIIVAIIAVIAFCVNTCSGSSSSYADKEIEVEEVLDSVVVDYDEDTEDYEEMVVEEVVEEPKCQLVYSEESGDLIYIDRYGNASPANVDNEGKAYIYDDEGNIVYIED